MIAATTKKQAAMFSLSFMISVFDEWREPFFRRAP